MKLNKRQKIDKPEKVYNLHVKNDHNYVANGVVASNCHNSKAQVLRKLLTTSLAHIPIRWGITGTIPKEEHHKQSLISGIGEILEDQTVKSSDLQDKGILADLHIDVWQTDDTSMPRYSSYSDEHNWLCTNKDRLSYLGQKINQIGKTGNTLVLVDRIATGKKLLEEVPNGYFISGSMPVKKREEILDKMNTEDDVVVVATYGTSSTGINVPRIFNLVLFEAGKSFVRVIQTIGRGIRKAKDKDFVQIYDICSNGKYSSKHLSERKSYYRENKFEFTMEKIGYEE